MEEMKCNKCRYSKLASRQHLLMLDLSTALYDTIIFENERVIHMEFIIEDYFEELSSEEILQLKEYMCTNCKDRKRVTSTVDIIEEIYDVLKSKKLSECEKYNAVNDLYDKYFETAGSF